MWELDYKESWVLKNLCFWTVVLEKTLASPLDWKEIQPVHPKGNQPWVFIGRTDAEAETPILWLLGAKNSLVKTLMLGKVEGRKRRRGKRMRWLNDITDSMDMSLSQLRELVMARKAGMLQSLGSQRVRHDWVTEPNWTGFDEYCTYWWVSLSCQTGLFSMKPFIPSPKGKNSLLREEVQSNIRLPWWLRW